MKTHSPRVPPPVTADFFFQELTSAHARAQEVVLREEEAQRQDEEREEEMDRLRAESRVQVHSLYFLALRAQKYKY